jgi:hypothetical protein
LRARAGLETQDKQRRAILLSTTLFTERETEDYRWRKNERANRCPNCKQVGHFSADCPTPHFGCSNSICYIVENHQHYTSGPCQMASVFVARQLKDMDKIARAEREDEARIAKEAKDENEEYWEKLMASEYTALVGEPSNAHENWD